MSDNDLIRRGDAKREVSAAMWARSNEEFQRRLNAIPAVQPTVSPKQLAAQSDAVAALMGAAEVLLMQHDFENPMRHADYHGDICQCRRCRMDALRAALARVKDEIK